MTTYNAKDRNRKVEAGAMHPVFVGNTTDNLLPVTLFDADGNSLAINTFDSILVVTESEHYEVHQGDTYRVWYVVPHTSLLADDGQINIVLTTTTKRIHISAAIAGGGDFEYYVYRSPTFNGGTPMTVHNLNDASSNTTTVTAVLNPTVTVDGTQIDGEYKSGGMGGVAQGGAIRNNTEDIFRSATSYLLRVINRAGLAKQFSIEAQWYEVG